MMGGIQVSLIGNTTIRCLRLSALMLVLAGLSPPVRAADDGPPDVVVFCDPTLEPALVNVARMWRGQTGVPVHVLTAPTALLLEQLSHRIRSDIIIGEGAAAAEQATARQLIDPQSRFDAWRNRLVVAEAAAGPKHPAGPLGPETLSGTGRIAIVDAPVGTAGAGTRQALEAAGLWDGMQSRLIGTAGTADASFLLAEGKVRFAVIYATDLAANPGFASAGMLADETYQPILYWVAQTSARVSPNAAKFEAFLRQPSAQDSLRKDGLEVLP
jgi:molybdate transport system substrate-binding protein